MPRNHTVSPKLSLFMGLLLFSALLFSCGHKAAKVEKNNEKEAIVAASSSQKGSSPMLQSPYLQLLVAFETIPPKADRQKLWEKHHLNEIEQVGKNALFLVEAPSKTTQEELDALRKALSAEKGVRYAEPNVQMRIFK